MLQLLQLGENSVFNVDFSSEIQFQLDSLCLFFHEQETQSLKYLRSFLITQKKILKDVKTIVVQPHLNKIRILETNSIYQIKAPSEILPPNQFTTILIDSLYWYQTRLYDDVSKMFPKSEVLHVTTFCNQTAASISKHFKTLKSLHCENFKATNIIDESFFINLQEFTTSRQVSTEFLDLSNKLNVKAIK